ncbi:MAG: ATP-binding protein [Bacteroidales bacterium]|nr:ATP-binding protein [Bacteroidales bacterium]
MKALRVSVTGPESTGKSELAEQLAVHYQTVWVPEYAREYLDGLNRPYTRDDILEIAKGQLHREQELLHSANRLLICDTDLIVTSIWSGFKYGSVDPWITEHIEAFPHDLYLLMDIDIPWEEDPLREYPGKRKELFDLFYGELSGLGFLFRVISGTGDKRFRNALRAVEELLYGLPGR